MKTNDIAKAAGIHIEGKTPLCRAPFKLEKGGPGDTRYRSEFHCPNFTFRKYHILINFI